MTVKANLSVQLFADAVLVAESDDQELWQAVLNAIHRNKSVAALSTGASPVLGSAAAPIAVVDGPTGSFAAELGVTEDELKGACGPTHEAPFIQLDQRYWEALKAKTGQRGKESIAPISLAATLLCLWFKHARLEGTPTIAQCQSALATIGLRDQNSSRSLANTEWLQNRSGRVQINPAQWSLAVRLAKAYCLKKSLRELQADVTA